MDFDVANDYIQKNMPEIVANMPSLLEAAGGVENAVLMLNSVKQESITWKGKKINLDLYPADKNDPVLIFFTGIANYSRFYFVFLSLLSKKGFNVIGLDRPGHGFSEGKRGDCTVEDMRELMPDVLKYAKNKFNDRIGMFGSSLGGITTFYLLPELEGVKSAICHNWLYPGESADESKWLLNFILKKVNLVAPGITIPIRKLVDSEKVLELTDSEYLTDYYVNIQNDPIYCQGLTLRSVVSYFGGYRPVNSYKDVKIPVLGLIPEREKVLPFETSMKWWTMAGFDKENIKIIPDAKHMIFHDKPLESLDLVDDWFKKTL